MECPRSALFPLLKEFFVLDAVVSRSSTRWCFQRVFLKCLPQSFWKKISNPIWQPAHLFSGGFEEKRLPTKSTICTKKLGLKPIICTRNVGWSSSISKPTFCFLLIWMAVSIIPCFPKLVFSPCLAGTLDNGFHGFRGGLRRKWHRRSGQGHRQKGGRGGSWLVGSHEGNGGFQGGLDVGWRWVVCWFCDMVKSINLIESPFQEDVVLVRQLFEVNSSIENLTSFEFGLVMY